MSDDEHDYEVGGSDGSDSDNEGRVNKKVVARKIGGGLIRAAALYSGGGEDEEDDAGQEEEDDDQFFRPKHRSGGDSQGLDNDTLNALDGTKVRLQSSSSGVESVYRMVFCGSL